MDKTLLIENACTELMAYGVPDRKMQLKRFVKKYMLGRKAAPKDMIFWPTGLLAEGLWHCRTELALQCGKGWKKESFDVELAQGQVRQIESVLEAYFDRWRKKGMPLYFLDDLVAGETFLEQYLSRSADKEQASWQQDTRTRQYREAVDKMASFAMEYAKDETGSLLYRAKQRNGYVFADMLGLVCPFLYRYGMAFDRQECMELALKQIANFLAYGMDGESGLPYHGYDMAEGCKYGIIGWGRAVGWTLRGMSGCFLSDYGRERLRTPFVRLMDTVLAYQRSDGAFSWQLQALEGPLDTSVTGMICTALKEGIELKILVGDNYRQALGRGKDSLARSIHEGKVYDCSGECEGFAQYPQRYGAYPWALGLALMILDDMTET
jgi:rhamnogalacturonyl hydrolase YesR